MPRIARIYIEEGIFHILARGNNRQWVFKDEKDFLKYKHILQELKAEHPFQLYHYCLMNNHAHLIMEVNPKTEEAEEAKGVSLVEHAGREEYDGEGF